MTPSDDRGRGTRPSVAPAVVLITPLDGGLASNGTGFVIANTEAGAKVLTCSHVVGHDPLAKVLVDGRAPSLIETAFDLGLDLALLTVPELSAPPLAIGGLDLTDELLRYVGFSKLYVDDYMRTRVDIRLTRALDLQHARARQSFLAFEMEVAGDGGVQPGHSGAPLMLGAEAVGVVSHRLGEGKKGLVLALRAALRQWPVTESFVGVERDLEPEEQRAKMVASPPPPTKLAFATAPPRQSQDPEDANVGRFGPAERDGYRLKGILKNANRRSFFIFDLIVERTDLTVPDIQGVRFFLHETFEPSRFVVRKKSDAADVRLEDITSYGVFTAGAQVLRVDGVEVLLGYDVATLPGLPETFRSV
jgi:hypothetical protein